MDLKSTRETLGWTIDNFAEALDVPRSTYQKWERGDRAMPSSARSCIEMLLFIRREGLLNKWVYEKNLKIPKDQMK